MTHNLTLHFQWICKHGRPTPHPHSPGITIQNLPLPNHEGSVISREVTDVDHWPQRWHHSKVLAMCEVIAKPCGYSSVASKRYAMFSHLLVSEGRNITGSNHTGLQHRACTSSKEVSSATLGVWWVWLSCSVWRGGDRKGWGIGINCSWGKTMGEKWRERETLQLHQKQDSPLWHEFRLCILAPTNSTWYCHMLACSTLPGHWQLVQSTSV